ncbi:PARS [Mytilus edulis]|uniref:PARS n=1 Tax=Mytilus edulis TaxID=6550 RepID=A0A8S3PPZ1_MYTED|nr:PARS [Mytilus edulis]
MLASCFKIYRKFHHKIHSYTAKSHKLMIYNDIIQNCHPGGFHLLPLGQRVLEKLIKVIDEELDTIGAQKICMPTLALASLWKKTDRWDSAGAELFRLKDRHKQDYCLGPAPPGIGSFFCSLPSEVSRLTSPNSSTTITLPSIRQVMSVISLN